MKATKKSAPFVLRPPSQNPAPRTDTATRDKDPTVACRLPPATRRELFGVAQGMGVRPTRILQDAVLMWLADFPKQYDAIALPNPGPTSPQSAHAYRMQTLGGMLELQVRGRLAAHEIEQLQKEEKASKALGRPLTSPAPSQPSQRRPQ